MSDRQWNSVHNQFSQLSELLENAQTIVADFGMRMKLTEIYGGELGVHRVDAGQVAFVHVYRAT